MESGPDIFIIYVRFHLENQENKNDYFAGQIHLPLQQPSEICLHAGKTA